MNSWLHILPTDLAYLIGIFLAHSDAKPGSDTTTVTPPIANIWLLKLNYLFIVNLQRKNFNLIGGITAIPGWNKAT